MKISSTFWIQDLTDWWRQQEPMYTMYLDFYNVACDIFSIIPQGVGVEATISIGQGVTSWGLSKTTCKNLHKKCCS